MTYHNDKWDQPHIDRGMYYVGMEVSYSMADQHNVHVYVQFVHV